MKTILYTIIVLLLPNCGAVDKSDPVVQDDSLQYYPTTPVELSQKEFRYYYTRAKEHFDNNLLSRNFNGGLIIAKNGAVVFEKYSGLADLRKTDSVNANTSLHIASVSKTFTAMAVLRLMEAGKLSLNDTMGKFFPGFPYKGITVRMLLCHRSGLPNYLNYLSELKQNDTCYSNTDVLNSLYTLLPKVDCNPGTRFCYSNTNYVLLALVIERVTGESYPAFMKRALFIPLQMNNSFVYTSADSTAAPSFDGYGTYWKPDPFDCTYGDKNIYSTPRDLLKWDQALYSNQILKKETLDSAFTPLSNERPSVHNYGLGWRMLNLPNGKKVLYHNGRWHGTNASFVRLMDEKATIIIIGNKFNRNIYIAAKEAYDIFGEYFSKDSSNKADEMDNTEGGPVAEKNSPAALDEKNILKTKR